MILNQNLCHLPGRHRDVVLSLMGRWQGKPSRWCSLSLTLLFVAAPVLGADEPFRFFAEAGYRNGSADGHLQVARGGEPGTTSRHRPTLDDLGLDKVAIVTAAVGVEWGRERIFLGGEWLELEGSDTLEESIVSQGRFFPADSLVAGKAHLDWYHLNYGHVFAVVDDVTITPFVGAALFDFEYALNGEGGATARRSFTKAAPELGIDLEWRPGGGPWSFGLHLSSTVGGRGMPSAAAEEFTVGYRIMDERGQSGTAYCGVAFQQMHYDDGHKQELPNDIEMDMGPLFVFGFRLSL